MSTTYAQRLKESVRKAGKTQHELAAHLQVTDAVVSQWIGGSRKPNLERTHEIASFLHVDPIWLAGLNEVDNPVATDAMEQEILTVFRTLTIRQKTTLLTEAYKMSDGNKDS